MEHPRHGHHAGGCILVLRLYPVGRLCKKKVSDEHHYEVYTCKDDEHLVDSAFAEILKHALHYGTCDSLCCTKTCNCKTCCQTFAVFKPKHQSLYRAQVTGSKTATHDKAVADVNSNKGKWITAVCAAPLNEETCSCHTTRETESFNQRRLVNVFFNKVSEECC